MSYATVIGVLEAALEYACRRWLVLPLHGVTDGGRCTCGNAGCGSVGKHPRTEHGVKDATSDEVTIRRWWAQWPDANVGVATGLVVVLDDDPRHGGDKSLAALEKKYGALPITLESRTGGGGRHLFFARRDGQIIRNSASKLGPGLDMRGEGGYAVLPPSVHRSGNQYRWENEYDPAPFPEWLARKLAECESQASMPNDSQGKIPQGQRNSHLTSLAGVMRRPGMSIEAIEVALLEENRRRCEPALPENEVRRIATSVGRYEPAVASAPTDWPEPAPLGDGLPPVPVFDVELLPSSLRPFVADVSELMQTPLDYAGAATIVSLAGCVNRRALIIPKSHDRSWCVVPNLWGGIIAPPGLMKSPILHAVTWPLARIEEKWRAEFERACDDFAIEKEQAELRWQAWREEYKRAVKRGDPEPIQPDRSLSTPVQKRLVLTDATFEKLHEILSQNPAGVLVTRDELTGWLSGLDRAGREGERAFFLEAWNGNSGHTIDRIGRGSIHVPAVCVSLFGNIQPARLRWYLSDALTGGPRDDGLCQRFQVLVWPDPPRDWKLVDRPANLVAQRTVDDVFSILAELSVDDPVRLAFAPDAQELFFVWWSELEHRLRGDCGLFPPVVSHLSKYRSLMPTLAGLFEIADVAGERGELSGDLLISLAHAKQAAALCEYLEHHARRVYSCAASPEIRDARELARHIRSRDLKPPFATRSVYLKGWSGLDTPERVRRALAVLEDAGWVRPAGSPVSASGGRPSEMWGVNPKVVCDA